MIEKLTPEQTARFPEFVDKWIKIGLSTEPADRPRAEAAIRLMYEAGGLLPPEKIVWFDSPMAMNIEFKKAGDKSVLDNIRGHVHDRVYDAVWDAVGALFGIVFTAVCGTLIVALITAVLGRLFILFGTVFRTVFGILFGTPLIALLMDLMRSTGWLSMITIEKCSEWSRRLTS